MWVISGLSGVGKTRLALEAARCVVGETLFLEFHAKEDDHAPLDVDGALRCLLEQLGVNRSVLRHGRARLAELWQRELSARQMTIILDDVPGAAALEDLLPKTGSCRVFITARQRLHGIPGASGHALDVLPERDAIALFSAIAGEAAISPDDIAAVVRRCHGLPIAINIEASRLRQDGRLPASPDAVQPGDTGGASEQLQQVLDSCYQALAEDERVLFRFLGVNPCPAFTSESAAAIAGVSVEATAETISVLFDRHLVDRAVDGGFKLHDSIRDYAAMVAGKEISRRDRHDAERRLLDYYRRQGERADRALYPHRQRASQSVMPPRQRPNPDLVDHARRWMKTEWKNALAAAEFAGRREWKRACADLAHAMAGFLDAEGHWDEAIGAHSHALRASRDLGDQFLTARALIDLSRSYLDKDLRRESLASAEEALEIYRSIGDRHGEAVAVNRIGVIRYFSGDYRGMLAYEQEAQSLYVQSGDRDGEAEAVFHCGISCMELGRLYESLDHFGRSLEIFERSGNAIGVASALNSIADAKLRQGLHREALDSYRRALSVCRRVGVRQKVATFMQNIGKVYLYKGDPERALVELRCALATFRQIGDAAWQARAMCDCGDAYLALGDFDQCRFYYDQAFAIAERIDDLRVKAAALRGVADTHRESDFPEEAMRYYNSSLKVAQEVEDPNLRAEIIDGIAKTMFRTRKTGAGKIYLRQARDLYVAAGAMEAAKSAELRLQILQDSAAGGDSLPATPA